VLPPNFANILQSGLDRHKLLLEEAVLKRKEK
jgi:hypothetical protein